MRLLLGILYLLTAIVHAMAVEVDHMLFSTAGSLADRHVRSFIQLPDRRIVILTQAGIDICDGTEAIHLEPDSSLTMPLERYNGFHHMYLTHDDRYLWIKNWNTLQCVDLGIESYVSPADVIKRLGFTDTAQDIYGDSHGRLWIVNGDSISGAPHGTAVALERERLPLLDIMSRNSSLYLFYGDGSVSVNSLNGLHRSIHTTDSGPTLTSHIVEHDGVFYQIRNNDHGELWSFDTGSRQWRLILSTPLRLNTLALTDSIALISSPRGIFSVNTSTASSRHYPLIRTLSGNILASEISSIYTDVDGNIWLGLYDRGTLCHNPARYTYRSISKPATARTVPGPASSVFSEMPDGSIHIADNGIDIKLSIVNGDSLVIIPDNVSHRELAGEYGSGASFTSSSGSIFINSDNCYELFLNNDSTDTVTPSRPLLTGITVNGEPYTSPDSTAISRVDAIELEHDRNFVTVEARMPRYDRRKTTFMYTLEGLDYRWNTVKSRSLKATYTALPPGNYTLRITTGEASDAPETRLAIRIKEPWWSTRAAYSCYIIAVILLIAVSMKVYSTLTKKKIEARQRETLMIERIHHLIAEVDRYKSESPDTDTLSNQASHTGTTGHTPLGGNEPSTAGSAMSDTDRRFIARAVELVEVNINTPGYTVEQLSRDMCMDRTGLYRKLTALLDQSPSLFIRDIRLRNAARLLREGQLSITEIADATGFSSTSYMSKCFQEQYGCKPSEYTRTNA